MVLQQVSCASSLVRSGLGTFNKSAGETSDSDFSIATSFPVLVNGGVSSSHKSATAPKILS